MMKIILAIAFLGAIGSAALADDGGVVAISVNDLKFGKASYDQNGNDVLKPLPVNDASRYQIQANGKEANKLMTLLPSSLTVMTGMYGKKYPNWVKTYNANFKALKITGTQDQPAVDVYCEGGTLDYSQTGNESKPPKFTAYRGGAHCTITVEPNYEDGDVEYNFDPRKAVCGK